MAVRHAARDTTGVLREEFCAGNFVGRTDQLAVLNGLLAADQGTRSVGVVVEGEAGIGRTRLLTQLSPAALGAGLMVLSGRPEPAGKSTPYGLIIDVLAGIATGTPGLRRVQAEIGRRSAEVTAGRPPPSPLQRDRLGRELIRVLDESPRRGTAMLVDDVHLADRESTDLLCYLLRHPPERPLVLILSCRSGRCPPEFTSGQEGRGPLRMVLPPLADTDLDGCLGSTSSARRQALLAAGGGNPSYLSALAGAPDAALAAIGRGECPERPLTHPGAEAITVEIRELPGALRRTLQAAAVIGCDLGVEAIAHVVGEPLSRVEENLDALTVRDLLRTDGERLDFRHPLIRAAAYWLAGPAQRVRTHTRAVGFLRSRGAPPARVAPHLARSAPWGDVLSAQALAAAAREAMATSPAISLTWLQAAARIAPGREDAAHQTLRGRALVLSGQFDRGTAVLREATEVAGPHRVAAVEHLAQLERLLGRYAQARALLTTELPTTSSRHEQALLRLELAASELFEARYAPAAAHARAALSIAHRDGHRGIEAAAAAVVAACALGTVALPRAVDRIDHARALFDRLPDTVVREELGGLALLAYGEFIIGRRATAAAHIERGLRVARGCGREHALPQMLMVRSELHLADGRVELSLADADEATALARSAGSTELWVIAASMALRPRLWQAGPDAVRGIVAGLDEHPAPRSPWFRVETTVVLGEVRLALGDDAGGERDGGSDDTAELSAFGPPAASVFCLRARTADGRRAEQLLRYAQRAAAELPFYRAQVSATRAHRAARTGFTAQAVQHIGAAVDDYAAAGTPLWEGQARTCLAEALSDGGDIDAARRELGAAKSLFAAAGAGWLRSQAARAQRRHSARLPRGTSQSTLTRRELQVAALVTAGLTNAGIARELVLSDRTIETHLTRIFSRLGVRSRAAVAHWYTCTTLADRASPAGLQPSGSD